MSFRRRFNKRRAMAAEIQHVRKKLQAAAYHLGGTGNAASWSLWCTVAAGAYLQMCPCPDYRWLFNKIDKNRNHVLDKKEFIKAVRTVGKAALCVRA